MPVTYEVLGEDGRRIARRLSRPAADSLARRVEAATGETARLVCEQPHLEHPEPAPAEDAAGEEPQAVEPVKADRKSRRR